MGKEGRIGTFLKGLIPAAPHPKKDQWSVDFGCECDRWVKDCSSLANKRDQTAELLLPARPRDQYQRLNDSLKKYREMTFLTSGTHAFADVFGASREEMETIMGDVDGNQTAPYYMQLARDLLLLEFIESQRALLEKHDIERTVAESYRLEKLFYCGKVLIPISEISLVELFSRPDNDPAFSEDYLTTAMGSCIIALPLKGYSDEMYSQLGELILGHSGNPLFKDYPHLADYSLSQGVSYAIALSSADPITLRQGLNMVDQDGATINVKRKALGIARRVDLSRSSLNEALFNPEKTGANQSLQDSISKYLKEGGAIADYLLRLVKLGSFDATIAAYLRTQELVSRNVSPEFYKLLAEAIHDYAVFSGVATAEDIEDITESSAQAFSVNKGSLFEKLKQMAGAITRLSDQETYEIADPEVLQKVDWGIFVQPKRVFVDFDREFPRQFSVYLIYENLKTNEDLEVEFSFNTPTKNIKWSVLEPLSGEGFELHRQSAMQFASSLLEKVVIEAKDARDIARQIDTPSKETGKEKTVREDKVHYRDPIYDIRRNRTNPDQPIQTDVTFREKVAGRNGGIKYEISLTRESDNMADLSPDVRDSVHNAIDKFNSGIGLRNFSFVGGRRSGEALYRIRDGHIRIILKEEGSDERHRRFQIVEAGRRDKIYRGL